MARFTRRTALATAATALALGAAAPSASASAGMTASGTVTAPGGAVVERLDCAWTTGAPDGAGCRAIVGDAPDAVAFLRDRGATGLQADIASTDGAYASTIELSRRADGTWLSRGRGTDALRGRTWDYGFVCDAAGTHCVPWVANTGAPRAASASVAIRRATKRLKVRARS